MISVIIPLYNKEQIIERTVQSVLEQSYKNVEVIIIDDGSIDGSYNIVENIHDSRIRLIHQENGGPSKARNQGVKNAKGDWILFLDADDELMPGALEHFDMLIKNNNGVELICCEFITKKQNKETQQYEYKDGLNNNGHKAWFFGEICPRTGATIYSRNLVLKCPFNEEIRRFEDLECLCRMFHYSLVLLSHHIVLTQNVDYASASSARSSIKEDFLGHLDFKRKSFWERMCLYQFYLWERDHYPEEVNKLYPTLRWRYDLLLLVKMLHLLKKHHVL